MKIPFIGACLCMAGWAADPSGSFAVGSERLDLAGIPGQIRTTTHLELTPPSPGATLSSNASWLSARHDPARPGIVIVEADPADPGLPGSGAGTAILSIEDATATVELPVSFVVKPMELVKLLPDPARPRIYALHKPGREAGLLVSIDTTTRTVTSLTALGSEPTDLDLNEDASELLVMNTSDPSIARVDLESLRVVETHFLDQFNTRNEEFGGHIEDGPGSVVYYVDEQRGPRLRTYDLASGTVLQTLGAESGFSPNSSDNDGFGDIEVSPDGRHLFGWRQYGTITGNNGTHVVRFSIGPDGLLSDFVRSKATARPHFQRDPLDTPVLMSADGERLVIKDREIDQDDPDVHPVVYPEEVYAMSPGGEVVCGDSGIYPGDGGDPILSFPRRAACQAITPDYTWHVGFVDRFLWWTNLRDSPGLAAMGLSLRPAEGTTVPAPKRLHWLPTEGALGYRVYLGTDVAAVTAAGPDSPLLLGQTPLPRIEVGISLDPGTPHFWKVESILPGGTVAGAPHSFTVSPLVVDTEPLEVEMIEDVEAVTREVVIGDSGAPLSWTAASDVAWIVPEQNSGSTPAGLRLRISSLGLPPGLHQGTVTVSSGNTVAGIPVRLRVFETDIIQLASDPVRPVIYALASVDPLDGDSQLLFVNPLTRRFETCLPLGRGTDAIAYHPGDARLYAATGGTGSLTVIDAADRVFLPPLALDSGTDATADVEEIVPLDPGRLCLNGRNRGLVIVDLTNGSVSDPYDMGGRGVYDPVHNIYYHQETGSSGDELSAHDLSVDPPVKTPGPSLYFGGPAVHVSADGQRVFAQEGRFNRELEMVARFPDDILEIDPDGMVAISADSIWWADGMALVTRLPVVSQRLALNVPGNVLMQVENSSGRLVFTDFSTLVDLPGPRPRPGQRLDSPPVELAWSPVEGATGYWIRLSTDPERLSARSSVIGSSTEPNWSFGTPLDRGGVYYWQIETLFTGRSEFSPVYSFTVGYREHRVRGASLGHAVSLSDLAFGHDLLAIGGPGRVGFYRFDRATGEAGFIENRFKGDRSSDFGRQVAVDDSDITVKSADPEGFEIFPIDTDRTPGWPSQLTVPGYVGTGSEIASDGGIWMIGAPGDSNTPGAVLVYHRWPSWKIAQVLRPSNSGVGDGFGTAIDIDGNRLIVGSPGTGVGFSRRGSVTIFDRDPADGLWKESRTLATPEGERGSGKTVAIDGDVAATTLGEFFFPEAVQVYRLEPGSGWTASARLVAPENGGGFSTFGQALALDGDLLAVGDHRVTNSFGGNGRVYPFRLRPETGDWMPMARITPDPVANTFFEFGGFLDLRDGWLAAGHTSSGSHDEVYAWMFEIANAPNASPVFMDPPPWQGVEGRAFEHVLGVEDLEGDAVEVVVLQGPAWLGVRHDSGAGPVLTGTPPIGGPSNPTIQLRADDGQGQSHLTFELQILGAGERPVIGAVDPLHVLAEGDDFQVVVEAEGPGPMTWTLEKDGEPVVTNDGPRLSLYQIASDQGGSYRVRVANAVGDALSTPFTVQVLPGSRSNGPWATLGSGPERRGHYPATIGRHTFAPAWSATLSSEAPVRRAVVAEGRVFAVVDQFLHPDNALHAVNLATGARLWSRSFAECSLVNPPTWHDGKVYLQRGDRFFPDPLPYSLLCLDPEDGDLLWETPNASQNTRYEAPAVGPEGIFTAGGRDSGLYGYDLDGGERFFFDGLQFLRDWTPILSEGRLYTWQGGTFREHDTLAGAPLWELALPWEWASIRRIGTTPAVRGDDCLIQAGIEFSLLDLDTRERRWVVTPDEVFSGYPAIFRDRALVIDGTRIRCFRISDGFELSSYSWPSDTEAGPIGQPIVLNNLVIAADQDQTVIYDLESTQVLQVLPVGGLISFGEGHLVVATASGELHAYLANLPPGFTPTLPQTVDDPGTALPLAVPLRDHVSDPDELDELTWAIVSVSRPEIFRTLEIDPDTGDLTVVYNPWESGSSEVTVSVTDSAGNLTETTITFSVPPHPLPDPQLAEALVFNPQTGLYEHTLTVTNTALREIAGFDLAITGLPAGVEVYNASACEDGIWCVQHRQPLAAGASVTLILEYYAPVRGTAIEPEVAVSLVTEPESDPAAAAPGLAVDRCEMLDDGLLIEFTATPGALYEVQYSDDNATWKVSPTRLRAAGNRVQWIDRGPPRTDSPPTDKSSRFYRVRVLPENQ